MDDCVVEKYSCFEAYSSWGRTSGAVLRWISKDVLTFFCRMGFKKIKNP